MELLQLCPGIFTELLDSLQRSKDEQTAFMILKTMELLARGPGLHVFSESEGPKRVLEIAEQSQSS